MMILKRVRVLENEVRQGLFMGGWDKVKTW